MQSKRVSPRAKKISEPFLTVSVTQEFAGYMAYITTVMWIDEKQTAVYCSCDMLRHEFARSLVFPRPHVGTFAM